MITRRQLLVAATAAAAASRAGLPHARAEALAAPAGRVVLEIRGAIATRNAADAARFDLAMLQGIERATVRTTTPWTSGPQVFEGVPLRTLLGAVGATGTTLRLAAINDYEVEVPVDDAMRFPVLVAFSQNGQPMPVRERGPLWVIYPLDDWPELRQPLFHTRMIWQLKQIVVA